MESKFVHLHTHSHYSLLNALPKIPELLAAAKEHGMEALALTDNGNLYGAIEFYKAAKKMDIKPIIGIDAFVAARTRFDKEPGIDNRRARLILLAENLTGYKNLLKLVTASHLEGFYYKPRLDRELLEKHREGLIAILPSFSAETTNALKTNDEEGARRILSEYVALFGKDSVFLEITHHPEIAGHQELQEKIKKLAAATDTSLVAAHDVYYLKPEDHKARETLVRIQTGADTRTEQSGFDNDTEDFSFISQKQAQEYFKDTPEALENTIKIAERCDLEIPMQWMFPDYKIESGRTPDEEIRYLAYEGLTWRGLPKTEDVTKRLDYELDVIKQKGYSIYFLAVGDLIREARERGILTTIRGSVAGSLTTYVLGITNVNPLEYKLPFERFLNYERPSAPDIDMDFADNRRDEIIQYARDKYGEDKVAQIGTFGTMMARAAVRDVARALGYPYSTGDQIAKLIPIGSQGFPMTIDRAIETEKELAKLYKENKDAKEIIDLAKKIEGCARHISVHAAGVVIAPTPLTDYVALQHDPKGGHLITQYNMHAVGEDGVGLLKFDFLGIKNLAVLADAVKRVEEVHGTKIDIENIPLDDQKTFEMLSRGETEGVFQLNGSGMTRFLKDLKPSSIHDVNAMVALYRPGPMESIPSYIERKHNAHLVSYLDPRMKEILDLSYGVITYQDDVMMISIKLAGYSWLEADKLRKAMGKKIPAEMEAQREKLMEGLEKNGMTPEKAKKLWKLIEPFAAYGFNKAHAACYGKVAYQTAYMKANYPALYMAAVLTADAGDVDKVAVSINESKRLGIEVLPPDINESASDFTVVKSEDGKAKTSETRSPDAPKGASRENIRFGLRSIKNFGEGIGNFIIEEREENGRYTSLANFLERVHNRNLNKKSLEALIKCGALDQFGERGTMLANIETLLAFNKEFASAMQNQDSLFGAADTASTESTIALEETEPATQAEKLAWEKELLGLYISGHPLDQFREKLEKRSKTIQELKQTMSDGMTMIVAGIVEESKPIFTKSGDKMAFARIADYDDSIEAVVFPKVFTKYQDLLEPQKCIALKGRMSGRNGEKSLVVEAVKAL